MRVINEQDDYLEALRRPNWPMLHLHPIYFYIVIEVIIYGVDSLSNDYKRKLPCDIIIRIQDMLSDQGLNDAITTFYLTSNYIYSVPEAFIRSSRRYFLR
jgi:hypothetical protein